MVRKLSLATQKQDEDIYEDIKEYISLTPRKNIVHKREYTPLLIKDVGAILKKHGFAIRARHTIAEYLDKNFILRT